MDEFNLLQFLTMYLDGQLSEPMQKKAARLLLKDEKAKSLFASLQRATNQVKIALISTPYQPQPTPTGKSCLEQETMLLLGSGKLAKDKQVKVENHLLSCDHCLCKVLENIRTEIQMSKGSWPELPEKVREKLNQTCLVNEKEPAKSDENLHELCISLSELKLERHEFSAKTLQLKINASQSLSGNAMQLGLQLTDTGSGSERRQITINNCQTNRKYFSATTDPAGTLSVARLLPGTYLIHILGSPLKVRLKIID